MVVNGIAFLSTPDKNYSPRTCPRGKVSVEGWIKHLFHSQEENKCFIIKIRLLLYLQHHQNALDWNPQGKRRRGGPTTTWRRTIESELKACQLTWAEAKKAAKDRPKWRTVVEALCPCRGLKD